jgi:hypothetical protein
MSIEVTIAEELAAKLHSLTTERDAARAEVARLRMALDGVRGAIRYAGEGVLNGTLWMAKEDGKDETVVDFIDAALEQGEGT